MTETSSPHAGGGHSTNIRPLLFLDVAQQMMLDNSWPFRAVTVTMESHAGPGRFAFYGANHVDALAEMRAGRIDVSILNPSAMLAMAHRGIGAFDTPHDVAAIAVVPHTDQLGFAVREELGFNSLDEIAAARYPLKVSTRGSVDVCTSLMIDVVLRAHGFCLADLESWGGHVSYDQPMPPHPGRMGRLASGEIDAIFDEGTFIWVDRLKGAGAKLLPLSVERLDSLVVQGFRRGVIAAAGYETLSADVPAVDYGGWPIYCRADAPAELIERFCRALVTRRDQIVWDIGGVDQPSLPLEQMVSDSPATPLDVPLHPAAAAVWREQGWL
jgi:TRAP-type uncharacterized transport system substrate-binding protein